MSVQKFQNIQQLAKQQQQKLRTILSYPDWKAATITINTTVCCGDSVLHVRLTQPVILLQHTLTIRKAIETR